MPHCVIKNSGAAAIRTILSIVEKGPAILTDIAMEIGCTNNGARRYTNQLKEAGIINVVVGRAGLKPVSTVSLAVDAAGLSAYLERLKAITPAPDKRSRGYVPPVSTESIVHDLFRDMGMRRRQSKVTPRRDDLVAALFGAPRRPV